MNRRPTTFLPVSIVGHCHAGGLAGLLALILFCCGCHLDSWLHNGFKVGPNYTWPPSAEISESWIDEDNSQVDSSAESYPDWWTALDDPILNELILTAYEQNLSLREAGWRVMQARSQLAIAGGQLFPQTQQGFAEYDRLLESQSVALPPPLMAFDQWTGGFNLAWELDVWGRFRRGVTSAEANLEASIGDFDAILLSLIADVATAYTNYRTTQLRLQYARDNLEIQEASLKLTQTKADEGATGYTSVALAKSSLATTRAAVPTFEIALRQASNQLCTLLGVQTQELDELLGTGDIPIPPSEIAVGIPAELLRRRPDIRAAERVVAAQSEQIGIAAAELYPHFTITGEISVQSEHLRDLFTSSSTAGSVGPSVRWNLLNYGRIVNNVRLQGAGLEESIASYQNTVLTANQEVEDALVAYLKNQQRVVFLEEAAKESEEALRLLTLSFNEGEISFTGVFVLQSELAASQDRLAQARGDVTTSLIGVYKALGGGWQIRCPGFQQPLFPIDDQGLVEPFDGEMLESMEPDNDPANRNELSVQPGSANSTVDIPNPLNNETPTPDDEAPTPNDGKEPARW